MLNEDTTGAPRLAETQYREANSNEPERVYVIFDIERRPGMQLLDKASSLLQSSDYLVGGVIDELATEHLRSATGTTASIGEDGYAVIITATIPSTWTDPAVPSGHTTARTTPASLTPEQAAVLQAVEAAVTEALPDSRRHHAGALAEQVAGELPTREQVTDAYHRPTVEEVIDRYAEKYDPDGHQLMPKALRTVTLSYPHNPTAALPEAEPATAPAAAANRAAYQPLVNTSYGR
ncbi:hypothetical protein [Paenarthrobacter ureafaciens]|uniref:hypothetical protein n=1 Tax=Paenarthrobacter ureafaciens TaxID=37931 RepID=UPI00191735A5|nr:hypothetical protein [Paenarthrobacter ureafaciens]QQQ64323.1 hypothetical protein JHQ56_19810 [Paenarthrobacter ureafaciens]